MHSKLAMATADSDEVEIVIDQGTQLIRDTPAVKNGPETEKEWANVMEQIAAAEKHNGNLDTTHQF